MRLSPSSGLRACAVILALGSLPSFTVSAQFDRPVLPRRNLRVKVESDPANQETIHRLRSMRLEGSRMGEGDVGLEVVRLDRKYDIVEYHLVLDIVDTGYVFYRVGEKLDIQLADELITLATPGSTEGAWEVTRGNPAPPLDNRRPSLIYVRRVNYYPITADEMIAIALASEATFIIHSRERTYTRHLRGRNHDQFRSFVVHHVDGAPIPVNQPPG